MVIVMANSIAIQLFIGFWTELLSSFKCNATNGNVNAVRRHTRSHYFHGWTAEDYVSFLVKVYVERFRAVSNRESSSLLLGFLCKTVMVTNVNSWLGAD